MGLMRGGREVLEARDVSDDEGAVFGVVALDRIAVRVEQAQICKLAQLSTHEIDFLHLVIPNRKNIQCLQAAQAFNRFNLVVKE